MGFLEFSLRLFACPADPKFLGKNLFSGVAWKYWKEYPRFCYATDFIGVIDILAWAPYVLAQFFERGSDWNVFFCMLQVVCILKLDRRLPAFTLLDDVLATGETGRLLVMSGALSVMLWVLFAASLFIIEERQPEMDGAFENMPQALFTTVILIGGEWCRVDFTVPWGQMVGAMLALAGLGIISIPVAVFFDGYSDISETYVETYLANQGMDEEEEPILPVTTEAN